MLTQLPGTGSGAESGPAKPSIPQAGGARWDHLPGDTKSSSHTKTGCFKQKTCLDPYASKRSLCQENRQNTWQEGGFTKLIFLPQNIYFFAQENQHRGFFFPPQKNLEQKEITVPTAFALLPQQKAGLCRGELGPCWNTSTSGTCIRHQNYSPFPNGAKKSYLPRQEEPRHHSQHKAVGREGGTKLLQDKPGSRCSLLPSKRKNQGGKGAFRLIDTPRDTTVSQPCALALERAFFSPFFCLMGSRH